MKRITKFILVDDDDFNNMIGKMIIKHTVPGADVTIFNSPERALDYLQYSFAEDHEPAILFLDINMPTLSGWDFLDQYDRFSETVKDSVNIHILTSSVDPCDIARADENKYIKGFLSKPLVKEKILELSSAIDDQQV